MSMQSSTNQLAEPRAIRRLSVVRESTRASLLYRTQRRQTSASFSAVIGLVM